MIVAIGLFNRQRDIVNIIVKKQIITNRSVRSAGICVRILRYARARL